MSSDSRGSSNHENKFINTIVGWDSETETVTDDFRYKIIALANQKINLLDVLKQYNINLIETFSSSDWQYKALCPFPFHTEKTASFYCNPKTNWFHCFGCNYKGKGVEFLAFITTQDVFNIAKEILSDCDDLYSASEEIYTNSDIDDILFEFSDYIRDFIKKYKSEKSIQYAENVLWSFDIYLQTYIKNNMISISELNARIFKYKEALERFSHG